MKHSISYATRADFEKQADLLKAIAAAATEAAYGGMKFSDACLSCATNSTNWENDTDIGKATGIRLKQGKTAADGIQELFDFVERFTYDCASMQQAICYKGLLDTMGVQAFNQAFASIRFKGYNKNPATNAYYFSQAVFKGMNVAGGIELPLIPGQRVTFKNPSAREEAWKLENAIYVGDGLFACPGLGANFCYVMNEQQVISELNDLRFAGGETAYRVKSEFKWIAFPAGN